MGGDGVQHFVVSGRLDAAKWPLSFHVQDWSPIAALEDFLFRAKKVGFPDHR